MSLDETKDPHADMRRAIREWLREYRRRKGLKEGRSKPIDQRELARRLSLSRSTVDRWEAGRLWPTRAHRRMMQILGRDVGMGDFPPVPPSANRFLHPTLRD